MGNHTKKLVYGVGINDANYEVRPKASNHTCYFYVRWQSMLKRCYYTKFQSSQPTYANCKVCDEWHSFVAFKSWMESQDWEGKHLDKDLIGDGKLYSPDTCVFISQALNNLFTDRGANRGEHPLGVSWHKQARKFTAQININGKLKYLGCFINPVDAHAAWLKEKLAIANAFLSNESNTRIRYAIECGIAKLNKPQEIRNESRK